MISHQLLPEPVIIENLIDSLQYLSKSSVLKSGPAIVYKTLRY